MTFVYFGLSRFLCAFAKRKRAEPMDGRSSACAVSSPRISVSPSHAGRRGALVVVPAEPFDRKIGVAHALTRSSRRRLLDDRSTFRHPAKKSEP